MPTRRSATLVEALIPNGVLALGALVQGTIGFGVALVAAPLLVLVDPDLVPGPLLAAAVPLNLLVWYRERDAVTPGTFHWPMLGQVGGTVAAVAVFSLISARAISLLIGLVVLVAVLLSLLGLKVRPTSGKLIGAGVLSGFMGTTSAIPGPPLALVHQHVEASRFRATLAPFFLVGAALSLSGLAIAGRFGVPELQSSAGMLPGVLVGFLASGWAAPRINQRTLRYSVLLVSAAAAVAVLLRA
jgi:uncharacterized membrane protein YfcA